MISTMISTMISHKIVNRIHLTVLVIAIWQLLILGACSQKSNDKPGKKASEHLVETAIVQKKSLGIQRVRTGNLRALREVKVFNQEEGQINYFPFYEGDRVKKGVIVAKLDDRLLSAQLNRIQATRHKAEKDLARTKGLYQRKLVSGEELARAETELQVTQADEQVLLTRKNHTRIAAPITGVITERKTDPGNVAARYSHLLTISDLDSLITTVNVSELVLAHLKQGDKTQVSIDALGPQTFAGEITRIHPKMDPVTHQGTIEVQLKSVPPEARPGQLCRVQLKTQISPRIVIPFQALRSDTNGEYVFKLDKDNRAQRTPVISGQRIDERIEIVSGLQANDQVIIKGFLGLSHNKTVKTVSKAASPKSATESTVLP